MKLALLENSNESIGVMLEHLADTSIVDALQHEIAKGQQMRTSHLEIEFEPATWLRSAVSGKCAECQTPFKVGEKVLSTKLHIFCGSCGLELSEIWLDEVQDTRSYGGTA